MNTYSAYSDEELVTLSQQADEKALALLTEKYMNVAKYIASSFSSDGDEKSDLVQEGMLGFLSAVYSYKTDGGASFNFYCSRCIKNKIMSHLRKNSSKKHIPDGMLIPLEEKNDLISPEFSPEELLVSQKNAQIISEVISLSLSESEKKVFGLHLAGLSYKEIAEKLGLSVKSVDSTLQRCRKKLREKLHNEV